MGVQVISKEYFHYITVGYLPQLYTPVPSQDRVSAPPKAGIELALLRGLLVALGKLLKLENWHKKLEKL